MTSLFVEPRGETRIPNEFVRRSRAIMESVHGNHTGQDVSNSVRKL